MSFQQDKYDHVPNRWYCDDCNASIRRVEEPNFCPNCAEMEEPIWADRWRLTGRAVKVGEKLTERGGVSREVYLVVGYDRPGESNGYRNDIVHLALSEAWDNGVTSSGVADNLTQEQCADLAVMFWKLSQGWPLENMEKEEV